MNEALKLIVLASISVGLAGCAWMPGKKAAPVPAPGGSYPLLGFFARANKTSYYAFSFDRGVPYDPEDVLSADQRWDFSARIRLTAAGAVLDLDNRCAADIPLWIDSVGEGVTVHAKTKVSLPMKDPSDLVMLFFRIYDVHAIATHGALGRHTHRPPVPGDEQDQLRIQYGSPYRY